MLQGFATARGAKRCHCEERSAVIARSEATRQSVLPLPPSARKVAARSADGERCHTVLLSPSRLRRQPPPRGSLAARLRRARWRRGDVGIAPCEMTCRAGPMCPAAKDTFFPAGHADPALQGARVLGGQSRPPLQVGRRTPVRAYSYVRSHNCHRLGRSSGRPA